MIHCVFPHVRLVGVKRILLGVELLSQRLACCETVIVAQKTCRVMEGLHDVLVVNGVSQPLIPEVSIRSLSLITIAEVSCVLVLLWKGGSLTGNRLGSY